MNFKPFELFELFKYMTYLLLTTLFTIAWFIVFRLFRSYQINTFTAVFTNYWVCVLTGLTTFGFGKILPQINLGETWQLLALSLGALFIGTFYLTAYSTQHAGVTITSVSAKMSFVLTVVLSRLIIPSNDVLDILNILGMCVVIGAIFAVTHQPKALLNVEKNENQTNILVPLLVFGLTVLVDTSVNYLNAYYVKPADSALFSVLTFMGAGCVGLVIVVFKIINGQFAWQAKNFIGGIALGVPNFFSLYYLLLALQAFDNNGAFLFPVFNAFVILGSAVAGVLLFKEKLSWINYLGLLLALLSIGLMAHQKIFLGE